MYDKFGCLDMQDTAKFSWMLLTNNLFLRNSHLYTWDRGSCFVSFTAKQRGIPSQGVSDPIQRELHAVWDGGSDRTGPGSSLPCSPVLHQAALPADRPAGPRHQLPQGELTSKLLSRQRPQPPTRLVTGRHRWDEGGMEQSTWRPPNQQQWVSDCDTVSVTEGIYDSNIELLVSQKDQKKEFLTLSPAYLVGNQWPKSNL